MKNKGKNKNKKIISILAIFLIIAGSLLGLYFVNQEEHTDEVKKYEVVYEEKEARLKVLDEITLPQIEVDFLIETPLKKVKKDLSMQYILNIIKDYDKTFEVKDYTLIYNGSSVSYFFSLYYKIENLVETTKDYTVFVKDRKVDYIVIGGVKDNEKINNLINFDKEKILNLASNFKGEYKAKKIYEYRKRIFKTDKVLKKDGTIDPDNINYETKSIEEKFTYDFNDEKLSYKALIEPRYDDDEIGEDAFISTLLIKKLSIFIN